MKKFIRSPFFLACSIVLLGVFGAVGFMFFSSEKTNSTNFWATQVSHPSVRYYYVQDYFAKGLKEYTQGHYTESLGSMHAFIKLSTREEYAGQLADAYACYGKACYQADLNEDAIEKLSKALALYENISTVDPERFSSDIADTYAERAMCHEEMGDTSRAINDYVKSVTASPVDVVYVLLCKLLYERGSINLAIFYAEQGLKTCSEKAEILEFYDEFLRKEKEENL